MTNEDLFVQILSEMFADVPDEKLRSAVKKRFSGHKLDAAADDQLLDQLRNEKPGIVNWLIRDEALLNEIRALQSDICKNTD